LKDALRGVLQAARSSLADGYVAGVIKAVFDSALSSDDLDWLSSLSPLRVLLKGILHPDVQGVP
jgi:isopentenyl diphosphate isomerase/L-lactate dehydrogenase-like FMN-dependent dehydrogenase